MPVLGSAFGQTTRGFTQNLQDLFVAAFIAGPRGFVGQGGTPAQQVVQTVLLKAIGAQWDPPGPGRGPESPAMTAATRRFAALSAGGPARLARRPPGRAAGRSHHPGPAAVTTAGLRETGASRGGVPAAAAPGPGRPAPGVAAPGQPPRAGGPGGAGPLRARAAGRAVLALEPGQRERRAGAGGDSGGRGRVRHRRHRPEPVRRPGAGHRAVAALPAAGDCGGTHRGGLRRVVRRCGRGAVARRHPGHPAQHGRADRHRPAPGRGHRRRAGLGRPDGLHDRELVRGEPDGWTTPWLWPARPPHDLGGALCAGLVFAAGIVAATVRGARAPREM